VTHGDWKAPHHATGPEVFATFAPDLGELFKKSKVRFHRTLWLCRAHAHDNLGWLKGGLRLRHDQPAGRLEMTGKSHNRSRSTWEGRATRDFTDVDLMGR
jgi:hypothetical protein